MATLILQGSALTADTAQQIARQVDGHVELNNHYGAVHTHAPLPHELLQRLRSQATFDINVVPENFDASQVKLLVTDMDSTLINIECIDEIADFHNIKPQIAAITAAAMRGEIDFATSLTQRVGLLKGLDTAALEQVYQERLQLNPGAERLIVELHRRGIKVALVSGGFTFFTSRLQQRLHLDYTLANVLEVIDGKLTGQVVGAIVGAESKAHFLLELVKELGISPQQTIAMGDGANDLLMMQHAGLSIAYHAKPAVQQQALTALNYCGLEGVLGLMQVDG